eukprot:g6116.t1
MGLTVTTFTDGLRFAFRKAVANSFGIEIARVVLKNVRAAVFVDRRLRLHLRALGTAAGGVAFDVEMSVGSQGKADSVVARLKDDSTRTALLETFKVQVKEVAESGAYKDVPATFDMQALDAVTVAEIATPSTATEGDDGGSTSPVVAIGASLGGLVVVAAAALLVKKRHSRASARALADVTDVAQEGSTAIEADKEGSASKGEQRGVL